MEVREGVGVMPARVMTLTSGKGGVGKTTATANIGVGLARREQRALVIDADIGLRNLDVVLGLENRIVFDLVDVVEGRARLRQAMIKDKRLNERLQFLPAAQTRDKNAVSPEDMIAICEEVADQFDFIIVDSPAGIEQGFKNAVAPAHEVIVITNPEVSAVRDADRIIGLIESEQKGPARLIINRLNPTMVKRGDMLDTEDILEILGVELLGIVPEDESIVVSSNRGQPVALNGTTAAGAAYDRIVRRLLGEAVPILRPAAQEGFFQRLGKMLGASPR